LVKVTEVSGEHISSIFRAKEWGVYCLLVAFSAHSSKPKMETVRYSDMSVNFHQTTRRHIPADSTLQSPADSTFQSWRTILHLPTVAWLRLMKTLRPWNSIDWPSKKTMQRTYYGVLTGWTGCIKSIVLVRGTEKEQIAANPAWLKVV
jgi:hypothetical protein